MSDKQFNFLNDKKFNLTARIAMDASMIIVGITIAALVAIKLQSVFLALGVILLTSYVMYDIRVCITQIYKINQVLNRHRSYIQL